MGFIWTVSWMYIMYFYYYFHLLPLLFPFSSHIVPGQCSLCVSLSLSLFSLSLFLLRLFSLCKPGCPGTLCGPGWPLPPKYWV